MERKREGETVGNRGRRKETGVREGEREKKTRDSGRRTEKRLVTRKERGRGRGHQEEREGT